MILILCNSSVRRTLILCYFRHNVVCFAQFCQRKYKDKAELFVSEQHTAAFNFLMHVLNELGESFGALNHWRLGFEADHHQIDRCITSKYRESGSKACRVVCSL